MTRAASPSGLAGRGCGLIPGGPAEDGYVAVGPAGRRPLPLSGETTHVGAAPAGGHPAPPTLAPRPSDVVAQHPRAGPTFT